MSTDTVQLVDTEPYVAALAEPLRGGWRSGAYRQCIDLLADASDKECVALLPLIRAVVKHG